MSAAVWLHGFSACVSTVELGMVSVKVELCNQEIDVFGNQGTVALHAITARNTTRQTLEPANVGLGLFEDYWVAFLQDLVDGDESLECLSLVGHDGLTVPAVQYECDSCR
jgi:hypothetical protein